MDSQRVLVLGATGYVGGRLVPRLLEHGHKVRVLVRSSAKLIDVPWRERVDIVEGDITDRNAVRQAVRGINVIYYLVHSMGRTRHFDERDETMAHIVADEAHAANVNRVIYLSGLHPDTPKLSPHLRSRVRVGEILLNSGVPATVLQAGVIIGSGSASFEMIRHLTDVLPYMPAPRWVRNHIQPIAIRDVLYYLLESMRFDSTVNRTFDIGGPDVLRYGQMMNGYAREAGLPQRSIAALPVLTPWLAAQWVNLVTPIPRRIAIPLIESLQHDCVRHETDIDGYVPLPPEGPTPYRESVRLALNDVRHGRVETSWQDSTIENAPGDPLPSDPKWAGKTVFVDERVRVTDVPAEQLWEIIEGIGGKNGWYSFPGAWGFRGWIDKLVGGVGLRRGRRDPHRLQTGDALDFWRVEFIDRGKILRLRAEMRVPGSAWLELSCKPVETGGTEYRQRAIFFPRGLLGRLYWFSVLPFHGLIFARMAARITDEAQKTTNETP